MRQAFRDFGPADQMSEQRKATKMVRAFQVPGIDHLDAIVTGDANRMNNCHTRSLRRPSTHLAMLVAMLEDLRREILGSM